MIFELVHLGYSLPEGQAEKLNLFVPWSVIQSINQSINHSFIHLLSQSVSEETNKQTVK